MKLAWGAKVSPEFRGRVLRIGAHLDVDPSGVMAVMAFETGRTFSPSVWNAVNHAYVGLIQFGADAAADLGTTTQALAAMTAVDQLEYVERYFAMRIAKYGPLRTLSDLYMAVLYPPAIGVPENAPIFTAPSKAYEQNKALDVNKDGVITKAEAAAFVARVLAEGMEYATEERELRSDDALQPREGHMADTIETVAGITSIFNPAIGGVIGLAGNIFKAFSPMLQQKVAKEINRHTDDPAIGTQIAADLANTVLSQAKVLIGESDDFKAAAAITADPAHAEDLKKLEASVDSQVDRLSKAGDKATQWDQALWEAQNRGRQVVSTIAIEEKRAGLWDMTRTLVLIGGITASVIVGFIAFAIVYQSLFRDDGIDVGLVGLGGPLLMAAIQLWKDVFAYRFDGTKESTAQSQALIQAATKGKTT